MWARSRPHEGPSQPPSFSEALKIGAILADPPSSLGATSQEVRQGLELAQADLNAEWHDAPHLELVYADSGGSASTACEKARELKGRGVACLVEVVGSDQLAACAKPVRDEKLVVLTSLSSDPRLGAQLGSLFFRATPTDTYLVRELVDFSRSVKAQAPVLIVSEGESVELLRGAFMNACRGTGADRVLSVVRGQVGPQRVAERVTKLGADSVLLMTSPEDSAEIAAALKAAGKLVSLLGTSETVDPALLKKVGSDVLEKTFVVVRPDAGMPPRRAAVEDAWKRTFAGKVSGGPSPHVFAAYDALQVLARAAKEFKCDPEKTAARLRTVDYDGATGRVAFDENGERRGPPLQRRAFTDQGVQIPFARDVLSAPGTVR